MAADADINNIRPPSPVAPVRPVVKNPADKREKDDAARRQRRKKDDDDALVDTFA